MAATANAIENRTVPVNLTRYDINETGTSVDVVAGSTGNRHYVWGILATIPASNSLKLTSGNTPTDITPAFATTGLSLRPPVPSPAGAFPICKTGVGEKLTLTLGSSGAIAASVWVETAP